MEKPKQGRGVRVDRPRISLEDSGGRVVEGRGGVNDEFRVDWNSDWVEFLSQMVRHLPIIFLINLSPPLIAVQESTDRAFAAISLFSGECPEALQKR